MNKISIILGIVGAIVVIVCAVLGFRVLPDIVKKRTEDEVRLIPLSDTWNSWSDISRPVYMNVYILNVVNKDTLMEDGFPKFEEVGPYAYRQRRRKINISLTDGERLVSYEQQTHYFFDENASGQGLQESDEINILNLPFYMVLVSAGAAAPFIGNLLLSTEPIIRTTTVGELMFKGMNISNINAVLLALPNGTIPDAFSNDIFALYKGNNGSTDGVYKIHTGVGNSGVFGEILTYNGKSDLGFWNELSDCDKIEGSDGSLFPPFVTKDRVVNIFSSDICRSLYLTYLTEETVKDIKGYKFIVPQEVLEDPRINPANRCYCNKEDVEDCLGAGAIDVSKCRSDAPFVMSTPYFLGGNLNYSMDSGLYPNRVMHETALVIEPNSGALLRARKRIQLNMDYRNIPNVFAMNGTESLIFPILWVEESVEFTDKNAQDLKDKLLNPKKVIETWRWVGVGVGILIIIVGVGIYVWKG